MHCKKKSLVSSQVKVIFVILKKAKLSMGLNSPIILMADKIKQQQTFTSHTGGNNVEVGDISTFSQAGCSIDIACIDIRWENFPYAFLVLLFPLFNFFLKFSSGESLLRACVLLKKIKLWYNVCEQSYDCSVCVCVFCASSVHAHTLEMKKRN